MKLRSLIAITLLLFLTGVGNLWADDSTQPVCLVYRPASATGTSGGDWTAKAALTSGDNELYVTIAGSDLGRRTDTGFAGKCYFGFRTVDDTGWYSGKYFYVSTTGVNADVAIDGAATATKYAGESTSFNDNSLYVSLPDDKADYLYTFHFNTSTGAVSITSFKVGNGNPLTFTACADNSSVTFSWASGSNVAYKLSSGNWHIYTAGTTVSLSNGDAVSFAGKDVQTVSSDVNSISTSGRNTFGNTTNKFTMTGSITASGDVTSLTNGVGGDVALAKNCYAAMFKDCAVLTTAPSLPSTTLADHCYASMFENCTALATLPDNMLPATTMVEGCYDAMFEDCGALTSAPSLPATTLAAGCYQWMFDGCTALTGAPALPATMMVTDCYWAMFKGCTSLTSVPTLKPSVVASRCYSQMFQGCSKLYISKTTVASPTWNFANVSNPSNVSWCSDMISSAAAGSLTEVSGESDAKYMAYSTDDVAAVTTNTTTTYYTSFNNAFKAAYNAGTATITLLKDCNCSLTIVDFVVNSGKNITISGGTHTLTISSYMNVSGNLTIADGTFTTKSGWINSSYPQMFYVSGGSTTVNGGTITSTVCATPLRVSGGTLTVNAGTFTGQDRGVIVESGSANLNGGTYSGGSGGIYAKNNVASILGTGKGYYNADGTSVALDITATRINQAVQVAAADASATLSINATAGWGTFIVPFDAVIPESVTAYTVTVDGTTLNKTAVTTNKFAANIPYLVSGGGKSGTFYGNAVAATNNYTEGNLIGNVDAAKDIDYTEGSTTVNYLLQLQNSQVGFYKIAKAGLKVGKNRCYLTTTGSQAKESYFFDDIATEINEAASSKSQVPSDGKYIKNGKLIIIKNGKIYNAVGQQEK